MIKGSIMDCLIDKYPQIARKVSMEVQATECANDLLAIRKELAEDHRITDGKLDEILLLLHEAADLLLMSM